MARNFNGTPGLIIDNAFASTWIDRNGDKQINILDKSMAKSVVITKVAGDAFVTIAGCFATTMADGSADIIRVKNWVEFPKAELTGAVTRAIAAGEVWDASLPIGQNMTTDCRVIALSTAQAEAWGVDMTQAVLTAADGSTSVVEGFIALTTSAYLSILEDSLKALKPVAKANQGSASNPFDRTEIAEILPELKTRKHFALYLNTKEGQFVNLLATPRGTQRTQAIQSARQAQVAGTIYESMSVMPIASAPAPQAPSLMNRVQNGFSRS